MCQEMFENDTKGLWVCKLQQVNRFIFTLLLFVLVQVSRCWGCVAIRGSRCESCRRWHRLLLDVGHHQRRRISGSVFSILAWEYWFEILYQVSNYLLLYFCFRKLTCLTSLSKRRRRQPPRRQQQHLKQQRPPPPPQQQPLSPQQQLRTTCQRHSWNSWSQKVSLKKWKYTKN